MGCGVGVGAGGIGMMFFDSLALIIQSKFARFSFVMRLASAYSASCFSITWNRSMSIATDLAVCRGFGVGLGGSQKSIASPAFGLFVLLSYTNQCPAESVLL
jgi:hypothetical protein